MNSVQKIKSFRGRQLMKQEDVAKNLGISRQIYNSYENDLFHCDLDTIMKILRCLNVNENEIKEFFNALEQDYMSYYEKN